MSTTPERACVTTECDGVAKGASRLAAYKTKTGDCTVRLGSKSRIRGGSIPVQLTENTVELRDGSLDLPIVLQNLQKSNTPTVGEIMIRLPDGTLAAWDVSAFIGKKKLILQNGSLVFTDDYSSDFFSGAICEANCAEIDALLGVKRVVTSCPGEPDKIMYQICRVALDCGFDGSTDVACISVNVNPIPAQ